MTRLGNHATTQGEACLNCGVPLGGAFCSNCGQDARTPLRPLGDWLREAFRDLWGLDFRIAATLRALLLRPGELTAAYARGQRKPYTSPFKLYLVVSAVAIALMGLTGVMRFDQVLGGMTPEQLQQLDSLLPGVELSDPVVADRFERRFSTALPILNLFTPIGVALALALLRRKDYFHLHWVFGLHVAAAQVAYTTLFVPMMWLPEGARVALAALVLLLLAGYLFVALRKVYGGSIVSVTLTFVGLMISYFVIVNLLSIAAIAITLATL